MWTPWIQPTIWNPISVSDILIPTCYLHQGLTYKFIWTMIFYLLWHWIKIWEKKKKSSSKFSGCHGTDCSNRSLWFIICFSAAAQHWHFRLHSLSKSQNHHIPWALQVSTWVQFFEPWRWRQHVPPKRQVNL